MQRKYAYFLGGILTVAGVWGLIHPNILGIFTVDVLQCVIFLMLGLSGVLAALGRKSLSFNSSASWMLIILGLVSVIPGSFHKAVVEVLNVDPAISIAELALGVLTLIVYYTRTKHFSHSKLKVNIP